MAYFGMIGQQMVIRGGFSGDTFLGGDWDGNIWSRLAKAAGLLPAEQISNTTIEACRQGRAKRQLVDLNSG